MSADPQKPGAVAAGDDPTRVDAAAARDDAAAEAERKAAEARATELKEELRITDERRAEEEVAKAQEAEKAAEKERAKREQKRREAEERRKAAADEAEQARKVVAAERGEGATSPVVSGASVTAPGVGGETDPRAAASAATGARARLRPRGARTPEAVEGPEKPELYVAAAFAGAFLFARILKAIAR